ncbi:MAG TPA: fused MFS/spermidine synthase [Planctomycetota bacterium]
MSSPTPATRGTAPFVLPLYAATLCLSAFLLFAVQPMFTKMVLPLLGGSAAVWNTAVVFFQGTLLLGYAYAHCSTRFLGPKPQLVLHIVVLGLGFLALPIGVAAGWQPPRGETQIPWLIGLLAASIGLPFFAVSATAPLLQKWFAHTDHAAAGDPYFLYGASNLGSLAALLAYPFVLEPVLGLRAQGGAWTVGYGLLAAAIATCGLILVRRWRPVGASAQGDAGGGLVAEVTWPLRARWLALATVPSALLLGVTLHIGTDIAAAPFLWVMPLALYLLTFVIVFARRPILRHTWMVRAQVVLLVLLAVLYQIPALVALLVLHVGAMFVTAMVCHGELARLRPRATHLTEFYLWMSVGGVLGGILAAIVAPLVFDAVYEYPLALCAALLLRPWPQGRRGPWPWVLDLVLPALLYWLLAGGNPLAEPPAAEGWWRRAITAVVAGLGGSERTVLLAFKGTLVLGLLCFARRPLRLALAFLVTMFVLAPDVLNHPENRLMRERSFFGVYSVKKIEHPLGKVHLLLHGRVFHGGQNMDNPASPITYYTREGPIGQVMSVLRDWPERVERIGVVGLGVGQMASYVGHDQRLTYFEIDPLDERIARDERYFTMLADAGERVEVHIGDGRLLLEEEPDGAFGLLLVAAFSGDAIPVHLLTREALQLYMRKVSERGLVLFNVTNSYLDLLPVLGNLAADQGLAVRRSPSIQLTTPFALEADYVLVARRPELLARFGFLPHPWPELPPEPSIGLWTDDFSNLLEVMRWEGYDFLIE